MFMMYTVLFKNNKSKNILWEVSQVTTEEFFYIVLNRFVTSSTPADQQPWPHSSMSRLGLGSRVLSPSQLTRISDLTVP